MPKKCNSCNGVFEAFNPDGTRYFHACAPRVQMLVLNPDLTTTVVDLKDVGVRQILEDRTRDRANKRDENLVRGTFGATRTIKAAGTGVTDV